MFLPSRFEIQFLLEIIYNFQEKLYIFAGEKISAATEISSSPVVDIIFLLINELQIYRKTKEEAYN